MASNNRLANIEVLRFAAMFFIVFTHVKCLLYQPDLVSDTERFFERFTNVGIFSVDLFILISGYFLIGRTEMGFGRFFKILAETIFYSALITFVYLLFGEGSLKASLYDLCSSLNPLGPTRFNYWFVSRYLALLLFAPFLARFAQSLTKRQYKGLILVYMFVGASFCPIFPLGFYLCSQWMVWWFIGVFLVGGYIKLHYPINKSHRYKWLLVFITMSAIWLVLSNYKWFDGGYNSLISFTSAISLFCLFRTFNFKRGDTTINFLASHAFAAYLIQEQTFFKASIKLFAETYFPTDVTCHLYYTFFNTIIILAFAVCVDTIRVEFFKISGLDNFVKKLSDWCLETMRKWCA